MRASSRPTTCRRPIPSSTRPWVCTRWARCSQSEIAAKDGYAELFIPLVQDLPFLKKLNLDIGGRYSDYSNTPNATTFKVNIDAQLTNALRIRGGFNRATRAPNLGELYLGEQEYFGGGAVFGDPCSLRSTAPFGAGAAVADSGGS